MVTLAKRLTLFLFLLLPFLASGQRKLDSSLVDLSGIRALINTKALSVSTALSTRLDNLSALVGTNSTEIASLSSTADTHTGQISSLSGTVSTQATQIGSLNTSVTGLSSATGALSNSLATTNDNVASLSGTVSTQATQIGSLNTSVTGLASATATLTSNLATTNTNLASLSGTVGTHTAQISSLSTVTAGKLSASSNLSDVANAATARSNLGAAASTHTHPLSDLSQSGATTGQGVFWNGTGWAPGTISSGSSSYTALTDRPTLGTMASQNLTGVASLTGASATYTGSLTVAGTGSFSTISAVTGALTSSMTIGGNLVVGSVGSAAVSTTTPIQINLGSTVSSVAGSSPKFVIYETSAAGKYGISVSQSGNQEYIIPSGQNYNHNFYTNGALVASLGSSGINISASSPKLQLSGTNWLYGPTAGSTFVGAGGNTTLTGTNNTGLGNGAGVALTTGSGNLFLGYQAGASTTTGSNNIYLGNVNPSYQESNILRIPSSASVVIGSSASAVAGYTLQITGNSYFTGNLSVSGSLAPNVLNVWDQIRWLSGSGMKFQNNGGSEVARFTSANNFLMGTTTDVASSIATFNSTTQGILIPRMTTTQRNAIASPAEGLQAHNLTSHRPTFYNGSSWADLLTAADIPTSLSYLDATSSIQTQLNAKISKTDLSATAPLAYNSSTGAFSLPQASPSQAGYISATDYTTFANKGDVFMSGDNVYTGTNTYTRTMEGTDETGILINPQISLPDAVNPIAIKVDASAYGPGNLADIGLLELEVDGARKFRVNGAGVATGSTIALTGTTSVTSTYSVAATDHLILANASTATFTVVLPNVSSVIGQTFIVKRLNSGSNAVTIGSGGGTIEGGSSYTLTAQYKYVVVEATNDGYFIIGGN
ncbi:beta strand repeat-containing protein [Spirosoma aerolatum]|uniref:beta strand repeat-containing protein n=1 Tax=Spirosoma aerolatum TaxID=1211326 RepID=UPI0009AC0387|nr:hypothetical protein [Spirosoma aerolatum]